MTTDQIQTVSNQSNRTPSTSHLPIDPETLAQGIRVTQAQFARMCQVSRQTVSQWVKDGKVTVGPDGKIDPRKAASEVIRNSDPARLRARVFKVASEDAQALRDRIKSLETDLAKVRRDLERERCYTELANAALELAPGMVCERRRELTGLQNDGAASDLLEEIFEEAQILADESVKWPAWMIEHQRALRAGQVDFLHGTLFEGKT